MATEEYLPVTPGTILEANGSEFPRLIEDFVILKKNPSYKPATGAV